MSRRFTWLVEGESSPAGKWYRLYRLVSGHNISPRARTNRPPAGAPLKKSPNCRQPAASRRDSGNSRVEVAIMAHGQATAARARSLEPGGRWSKFGIKKGHSMGSFTAVHIGGQDSYAEAEDHATDERMDRFSRNEVTRDFEAKTLDDVLRIFDTLMADKAQLKYMDFHAHGYEAHIGLDNGSITLNSLSRFQDRGYHNMFAAGALIRIFSCEFAGSARG